MNYFKLMLTKIVNVEGSYQRRHSSGHQKGVGGFDAAEHIYGNIHHNNDHL